MPGRPQEEECKTVTVTKRRDLIWVKKCSKRAFLKAQVSFFKLENHISSCQCSERNIKSSHISIMSLQVCHNVREKVLDDSFHADHLLHLLSLSDEEK